MPRRARISTDEGAFRVLNRGNNKQWVFQDEKDFRAYKKILKKLREEHLFKLYHYCLMDNHVHLIIETNKTTELSRLMKRVDLFYYNHYKRKCDYAGRFWQGRFKSLLIEGNEYLLTCLWFVYRAQSCEGKDS